MKRAERRTEQAAATVLVVDDEADIRELLELTLLRMGLKVESAASVAEANALLKAKHFDLCLTDMRLPDGEGLDLVRHIGEHCHDLPVAVITAYGSAENAVAALKAGAFDYLSKPVSLEDLRALVKSALRLPQQMSAAKPARQQLLGESAAMQQAREMIYKLARSQAPVYISGESGSGKELAARLIHEQGARHDQPFVPVNCGAIPENLMESEFFGYKKGAFTGAEADREGFFQVAHGGTLFLDEVADLPLAMQVKLLRAIQEKRVRKVGATAEDAVDVRMICATHQNLTALVEAGKFRQDLYFRLNVIELKMPPLRECREDIPALAQAMLERLGGADKRVPRLSKEAQAALAEYDFPGNVRELENILERAVALRGGEDIQADDLRLTPARHSDEAPAGGKWPLQDYLDRIEREAILEALGMTRFNRTAAAKLLGITFRALRYRMERLGINEPRT
jgi:two-component system, NtrC family, response regulator PilR